MATIAAAVLFARITVLAPREGMHDEFEAGYKRHLAWHAAQPDTWSWLGWTVITGDRLGTFVDATVGREATDFDAPVAPAADAADNAKNVLPYARIVSSAIYRMTEGDVSQLRSPYLAMIRDVVGTDGLKPVATPGIVFRRVLVWRRASARRRPPHQSIVFELVSGGEVPQYLIFVPATKFSDLLTAQYAGTVEAIRFRPDLSYDAPAK